jgi:hypothetical protein
MLILGLALLTSQLLAELWIFSLSFFGTDRLICNHTKKTHADLAGN